MGSTSPAVTLVPLRDRLQLERRAFDDPILLTLLSQLIRCQVPERALGWQLACTPCKHSLSSMSTGAPLRQDAESWTLSLEWFRNRMEAKIGIERWRRHYNEERPHMSLGDLTPAEFKKQMGTTHGWLGESLTGVILQ